MPNPRQRKLDENELSTASLFNDNHHQNSVVVEEVGDEIVTESEVFFSFEFYHRRMLMKSFE